MVKNPKRLCAWGSADDRERDSEIVLLQMSGIALISLIGHGRENR